MTHAPKINSDVTWNEHTMDVNRYLLLLTANTLRGSCRTEICLYPDIPSEEHATGGLAYIGTVVLTSFVLAGSSLNRSESAQ